MAYVGTPLDTTNAFQSLAGKRFNGDGSTTDFTLDSSPNSTLDIEVFVGNVRQDPNSAYTVSGTTLAFTGAPPSGTNNIYVVHQAKSVGTIDIPSTFTSQAQTFSGGLTLSGTTTHSGALNVTGGLDLGDGNITDVGTIAADRVLGDADSDTYIDFPGSDIVTLNTGDNIRFRVDASGILSTGGETGPDVSKGGITLNQAQFDTNILTLKSSDIAHDMTDQDETDTYFAVKKKSGTDGGVQMSSYCEGDQAWRLIAAVNNDNTTQNATGNGAYHLQASKKTSNTYTTMGANANLMVVSNNGATRFIVDEDGDILYDGGASAYDAYDDAQLVRAFDINRAPDAIIQSKFDKFVDYNFDDLRKTGILGNQSEEDYKAGKKPFIKIGALQRLHNGAIWQQYEKHQQLLEAVYDLAKEAVGEEKANAILEKHEVKRLQ